MNIQPKPSSGASGKSGLWKFFSLSVSGPQKQRVCHCNLCKAKFLYSGNSSILSNHMKNCHPQFVHVKSSAQNTNATPTLGNAITIKPEPNAEKTLGTQVLNSKMSGRRQDVVWQYFVKVVHPGKTGCRAKCKNCGKEIQGLVARLKQHHLTCRIQLPDKKPPVIKTEQVSQFRPPPPAEYPASQPPSQQPAPQQRPHRSRESSTSSRESTKEATMSATSTPTKAAKDKERIVKLLHESILHLCKVSVSGPGEIEVDGIVCITQPNESDIVVKVHESFSNVHNAGDKDGPSESPQPGEKRKSSTDGGSKTPRKSVSRRLMSDETLDLTGEDEANKSTRSPHRGRNKNSGDVIDLTSGRETPAPPQLHITQVRSLGNQPRHNGPGGQYNQRFTNYRPRGPYPSRPRGRYMANMPPPLRNMGPGGNSVVPVGGPIPHRGFMRGPMMGRGGARMQQNMAAGPPPGNMVPQTGNMAPPPNNNMMGGPPAQGAPSTNNGQDVSIHGYKGLRCKYKDCGFSCSNKYYLETHVLQHFDSSPFSCNEPGCEFKTKNKQNLYQHYKVSHDANNPQFCFKCIKAFKSPDALNIHAQTCQVMSIKCDHCGENIQGLMAMARHLTEVYIAESQGSDSTPVQSPGSAQSPSTTPVVPLSPVVQSPSAAVPDMSSPLNIIPDIMSGPTTQAQSDLIGQELEKLERLSTDMQQDPPATSALAFQTPQDILNQVVSQADTDFPSLTTSASDQTMPTFEVLNNQTTTSGPSSEPITLQVPMDSDLQLPPGAEAITLELVPLDANNPSAQQALDKPPDLGGTSSS